MQFLNPSVLFGLLAIAIPIIIHLFYFRRFKRVYFSNVRFLKEIKEETSTRSRLRNLLVLLARILAFTALILAFAQPFIPTRNTEFTGDRNIGIFLDNSFSMEAKNGDVTLLEHGRSLALEIISAHNENEKYVVLSHDMRGKNMRISSKEDAISAIEELKLSPSVTQISSVIERMKNLFTKSPLQYYSIYVISDFQKSISSLPILSDTISEISLIPIQFLEERNISIDSCWFEAPVQMLNQPNRLFVRAVNHSDQDAENVRLSYIQGGQTKPMGTFNIPPKSSVIDTANIAVFEPGWHDIEVKITDFPVQFDDQYYISFEVANSFDVAVIVEDQIDPYLNSALQNLPSITFQKHSSQNVDYGNLQNNNLIILDELIAINSGMGASLKQFVENGGNVLIFPSDKIDANSYNLFMNTINGGSLSGADTASIQVSEINTRNYIFDDVFQKNRPNLTLPKVNLSYQFNFSGRGVESLLKFRNGRNFLSKVRLGQGSIYICSSPIDRKYNDLTRQAETFIPMIYKMAISGTAKKQIAFTVGGNDFIEVKNEKQNTQDLYKMTGNSEFIPGQISLGNNIVLDFGDQISDAGFMDLTLGDKRVRNLAFNFNRMESDLDCYSRQELESKYDNGYHILNSETKLAFSEFISRQNKGIILWKWFLVLALFFLLIESLLLRLWKSS